MTMTREELEDALDAYVLDLVDEETSERIERALDRHRDLADQVADMRLTISALAFGEVAETPMTLRRTTLETALRARPAGFGVEGVVACGGVEAYRETASALDAVLTALEPEAFAAETAYRRPVVELIAHLSAVEVYCGQVFGGGRPMADPDIGHLDLLDVDADLAAPTDVVARWRRNSAEVLAQAETLASDQLDTVVSFHGIPMSRDQLLAARAFELWTHTEDVLRAVDHPMAAPSPTTLRTMVETAMSLLSMIFSGTDGREARTIRITLTGSGGGSWVVPAPDDGVDFGAGSTSLLVADVVEFCRFVAGRIEPSHPIAAHRGGDESFLDEFLSLAPTMAEFGEGGRSAGS